jgi:serine/threonine protein kinase
MLDISNNRYYAMQLCKSTLEKSLSESDCYMGPLPIPEDILCQLADGLEYLHEKKLFHGNLKPSNALVYINRTEKGKEAIMKWSLPGLSTKPMKEKEIYAMGFGDLETSELSFAELCLADVFAEGVTFAYFLSEGKYQLDLEPSHPDNVAVIDSKSFYFLKD